MILLLLFCLFIALITPSGSTTTVTFSGRYLPRSVKRKVFAVDWMECLQACHSEPGCISCIYHKDEKVCEMNSNGEREGCGGKRTIFHQIRVRINFHEFFWKLKNKRNIFRISTDCYSRFENNSHKWLFVV